MKTKIKKITGKFQKLPLNSKLLIALLAVSVLGIGVAVATPSIEKSRQRAAAEVMYGKDFDKVETYMPQQRQAKPGGLGNVNRR